MKKNFGKVIKTVLTTSIIATLAFTSGCGTTAKGTETSEGGTSGAITVISREDGSGTRGAFIELTGVEEKDADGNKTDKTTTEAVISNSTDIVLTSVASDPNAIGYISLGSLNDTVKALKVDGVEATSENVSNKSYTLSRPFNIATKADVSDAAKDFMSYILSAEGQEVVGASYIKINDSAAAYAKSDAKGKVSVAGSSSVSPIMEKLIEAYAKVNTDVTVELNTSDSSTGMQNAINGTCDIGMASRELKDEEASSLTAQAIALDGIAVIVNNDNALSEITTEQIKNIYTGSTTDWADVK